MVSKQASSLAVILLSSFLSTGIMGISPAPLFITGGSLAAGWALQHQLVKPVCKKEMLEAIRDAGSITTKVAFSDAVAAYLESDWQNEFMIKNFGGFIKKHFKNPEYPMATWIKNGMKFVLYGEILSGTLECLEDYSLHVENSIKNNRDNENIEEGEVLDNEWSTRLVFALKDPVFRKAIGYYIFGFVNAWATLAISITFIDKLIPTKEPLYELDMNGNKIPTVSLNKFNGYKTVSLTKKIKDDDGNIRTKFVKGGLDRKALPVMHDKFDLAKKLLSTFAQAFGSSLIKNYVDDSVIYRDKNNTHDELYEKMYLIGIRSYFAWGPANKLGSDLGIFAS